MLETSYIKFFEKSSSAMILVEAVLYDGGYRYIVRDVNIQACELFDCERPAMGVEKDFYQLLDFYSDEIKLNLNKSAIKQQGGIIDMIPVSDKLRVRMIFNPCGGTTAVVVCVDMNERFAHISKNADLEKQAKQNQKQMEYLMGTIPGGMISFTYDGEFSVDYISDGILALLGYEREEYIKYIANNVEKSIWDEDVEAFWTMILNATKKHSPFNDTLRLKTKASKAITVHLNALPVSSDQNVQKWNAIITTSSNRFLLQNKMLDNSVTGVCVLDSENDQLLYVNKALFNIMNMEPCNYAGRACYNVFFGMSAPCSDCDRRMCEKDTFETYISRINKYLAITIREIDWQGKKAIIRYYQDITARKTAQDELMLKQQTLSAILGYEDIYWWEFILDTKEYIYCDQILERLKVEKNNNNYLNNIKDSGLIHPDDRENLHKIYKDMEKGKAARICEFRVRIDGPGFSWIRMKSTPITDKNGKVVKILYTCRDVSDEKNKQWKYNQMLSAYNNSDDSIIARYYLDVTSNTVEILDTSVLETKQRKFDNASYVLYQISERVLSDRGEFIDFFNYENLENMFLQGETEKTVEIKILNNERKVCWTETNTKLMKHPESGHLIAFVSVHDISVHKMGDILTQYIANEYFDFIMYIDTRYKSGFCYRKGLQKLVRIDDYSQTIKKIAEDIIKHVKKSSYEVDITQFTIENILANLDEKNEYEFLSTMETKSGRIFCMRNHFRYMPETETIIHTLKDETAVYLEELNKEKEISQALEREKSKSRTRATFISSVSHDIRTPMNAIIGMTDLALEDIHNESQIKESLSIIQDSSALLLDIINNFIDTSKLENGQVDLIEEVFDVNKEIDSVYFISKNIFEKRNQKHVLNLNLKHRYFKADHKKINRAVINLLTNASKYSPCGSVITTTVIEKEDGLLEIAVKDEGVGISKEQLPYIFTPYYRIQNNESRNIEGSGLGLAIVKSTVENCGGVLSVESIEGEGSTFYITVPMTVVDKMVINWDEEESRRESLKKLNGITILAAEDNEVNMVVLKKMLEKVNVKLVEAKNGREAVDIFKDSRAGTFKMIITDLQMPVMNGYEEAKAIRTSSHPEAKTIPIIAMSANAFDSDKEESIASGINMHLSKPVEPKSLYQAILSYIE